uniref:Uncharacterized protein n=1 Tax=Anguilla anguilla TaxID=7936 RepID=A0A0E9QD52_ANGAN
MTAGTEAVVVEGGAVGRENTSFEMPLVENAEMLNFFTRLSTTWAGEVLCVQPSAHLVHTFHIPAVSVPHKFTNRIIPLAKTICQNTYLSFFWEWVQTV